jgi:hypothetical protein
MIFFSCNSKKIQNKNFEITPQTLVVLLNKPDDEVSNYLGVGGWHILQEKYMATSWEHTKLGQGIVKSNNSFLLYMDASEYCMDNYYFLGYVLR